MSGTSYLSFEEVFRRTVYPSGESHISVHQHIDMSEVGTIEAYAMSFRHLCDALVGKEIFNRNGFNPLWFVPYMPFARDDRRVDEKHGLELSSAIGLVKSIGAFIVDPHSDVSGLLPHIRQSSCVELLRKRTNLFDGDPVILIPDHGATKKAYTWMTADERGRCMQGSKIRNVNDGKINGFSIDGPSDLEGRPVLIVDDICDGGGTFIGLADHLDRMNCGETRLAVTHGLFTRGQDELGQAFDEIAFFSFRGARYETPGWNAIAYRELWDQGCLVV